MIRKHDIFGVGKGVTYCDVQGDCVDCSPSVSVLQGENVVVWGRHRVDEPGQVVLHTTSCLSQGIQQQFQKASAQRILGA